MSVTSAKSYSAFGLSVVSDVELPALSPTAPLSRGAADVVVRRGAVDPPADVGDATVHRSSSDEYYLSYEVADVLIRNGRDVVVDSSPDVPHEVLRHVVLGPAFNHLLHQRGHFVLHASTVAVDDTAVAFVGESGAGKTTTAMAFLLDGCRVLSDDVAVVERSADGPVVRSGYPSIKLDPTIVDRFDVPVDDPPRTSSARDRHFHGLPHDQPRSPLPLGGIYLLEDADSIDVSPLPPEKRLMELVRNTYATGVFDDDAAASNFQRCAELATDVPVKRLRRPRRLDALSRVVDRVTEDLSDDSC